MSASPRSLLKKIEALPPERLHEVEDFVDFISAKSRRLKALDRLLAVAPAHEVLADYVDAVELVTPLAAPPVVTAGADDDNVVAAAVAAEADLIVSGDRHLLDLKTHQGILTPADALALLTPAA